MPTYGPGRVKLVLGLLLALILMVAGFVLITRTAGATDVRPTPAGPASTTAAGWSFHSTESTVSNVFYMPYLAYTSAARVQTSRVDPAGSAGAVLPTG